MRKSERFSEKLNSKLGLGTWQLGGSHVVDGKPTGWGDIAHDEAIDLVLAAIEKGIRFFDTSDAYGNGQSEMILGQAIIQSGIPRSSFIICTKFGHRELSQGNFGADYSPAWMQTAVRNSLERLQTNYIDILLFHSPPDNFDWKAYDQSIIEKLTSEGVIKQIGVSSKSVYGAAAVMQAGFGSVLEVIYNLLDRRAEEILFNNPAVKQYDFIGRVPMASGFLSNKYLKNAPEFGKDNYRSLMADRDKQWLLASAAKLQYLNTAHYNLSQAALAFCLGQKYLSAVIPGCRDINQLAEIAAVPHLNISIDLQKLAQAVPTVPDWWLPKS